MNNRLWVWTLCVVFILSACKKHPASSPAGAKTEKLAARNLEFENFAARGRIHLEEADGSKMSSNLSLRISKDSIIWASVVPGLGIEVARLRITPDSVYLINRLNRTFFAGDYALLRDKFKVDVNFAMVQALLLGNYLPGDTSQQKMLQEPPLQHIRHQQATLLIDQFLDLTDLKLRKLTIRDEQTSSALQVDYGNFESQQNHTYPRSARITVQQNQGSETKGTMATLEYNKVSINEPGLSFPFSIPQGYTRR